MAVIALQFQQRIPFVDKDGRLSNDGIRVLNSIARQIEQIVDLYGITSTLQDDLDAVEASPVALIGSQGAFPNGRKIVAQSARITITDGGAGGNVAIGLGPVDTDYVTEAGNLYFTVSRARNSISGSATVTYSAGTGVISLTAGNVSTALGYTPYDAANPAGYITAGGASSLNIRTITATTTPTATDYTLLCDATSGAITVNLPAASGQNKRVLNIKKIDASANTVTIDPNGAETVDGALTQIITPQWDSYTIQCNGSAWFRI